MGALASAGVRHASLLLPEVCGACSRGVQVACGVEGLQQLCQEGGSEWSAGLNHLGIQRTQPCKHIL